MRSGILLLGVALVMLAMIGFIDRAATWLSALDLVVGVTALAVVLLPDGIDAWVRAAPFAFGTSLAVLFVVGLAAGAERWLAWWTLLLGAGYLLLGAGLAASERAPRWQRRRHT